MLVCSYNKKCNVFWEVWEVNKAKKIKVARFQMAKILTVLSVHCSFSFQLYAGLLIRISRGGNVLTARAAMVMGMAVMKVK